MSGKKRSIKELSVNENVPSCFIKTRKNVAKTPTTC
jgi:hypothetical protein